MKTKVYWRYLFIAVAMFLACFAFHFALVEYVSEFFVCCYLVFLFPVFITLHGIRVLKNGQRIFRSNLAFCGCCLAFAFLFTIFCFILGSTVTELLIELVGLLLAVDVFVFSMVYFLILGIYLYSKNKNKK